MTSGTDHADFVVDARELGRQPGSMKVIKRDVTLTEDLGNDVIGFRTGDSLHLEVRLESVMTGVLVTANVSGDANGECGRCLGHMVHELDVTYQELYSYPEKVEEELSEDDESLVLMDETADLFQPTVDAVGLDLPFQPLCRPDCSGLDTPEGVELFTDPDNHAPLDPRWASLQHLVADSGDSQDKLAADHGDCKEK